MRTRALVTFVLCALIVGAWVTGASAANIYVPADHGTIQAAVDAAAVSGDVIYVAAGTYREQVKIDGKSLDIVGAGSGLTIVEAVDLIGRTTYTVTKWTASTEDIDPCIGIVGPATVNISDLKVDGRDLGPDHFYGIYYFDADGSVTDCILEGVLYTASPSSSKIASLVATHGETGSTTVTFSGNTIPDFQKGGILVMGPDADVTLLGNIINDVPTGALAGNGIQISYGATGYTYQNTVQGVGYTGEDWSSTGILLFESGSVMMEEDEVFDCQSAVNYSDWGWVHLHPSQVELDFVGLNLHDNEWTLGTQLSRDGSDIDVDITDCLVTDSSGDGIDLWGTGADPWGGSYYTGWDNGNLTARISGCTITNTTGYDGLWTGDFSGNVTNASDISVDDCHFAGNASSAVNHGLPEEMVADSNYWGDAAGPTIGSKGGDASVAMAIPSPFGAEMPKGTVVVSKHSASRAGDTIYGVIDYSPWYAAAPGTTPMPYGTDDSIQDAIDAATPGSVVTVGAGTYDETPNVNKPLTLVGDSGAKSYVYITGGMTLAAGLDGFTMSNFYITGAGANSSIVRMLGGVSNLTMTGCVLDGELVAGRHGFSGGQLEQNATVSGCEFKEILGWALFESRSGSGGGGSPLSTIVFADNYIHDSNGSVVFRGDETSWTDDVDIYGNTWTNINGNGGVVGDAWAAFEVNRAEDVDVYGNFVTGVSENSWGEGQAAQLWDITSLDLRNNVFNDNWEGIWVAGDPSPGGVIEYNSIAGNTDFGIQVDGTGTPFDAELNWWGDVSGPSTSKGTGDKALGNVDYDPWIGKAGGENIVCVPDPLILTVGDTDGQIAVKYLGGGGGLVAGYSVKFSWVPGVASTSLADVSEGALLSSVGSTQFMKYVSGANEITVDCALLSGVEGVSGPGTMFTIDFDAVAYGTGAVDVTLIKFRDKDNAPLSGFYEDDGEIQVDITNPSVTSVALENLTLVHTHEFAKDTDYLKLSATVTDEYTLTTSDIVANFSTLLTSGGTAVAAEGYTSNVATWIIYLEDVDLEADGLKTVTVTATDGLGNSASDSDDITVDNTPPGTVAGLAAGPAHEEVVLSWDVASGEDDNYYGVMVRYNVWGDYADYVAPAPAYPGAYNVGTQAFSGTGPVTGTTFGVVPRDIYYFSAFVYDWALNYGTVVTAGQDRSTNYWLGDVATTLGHWGYNGLVNPADINWLGGNYGSAPPDGVPGYEECDVGPTDDHSRIGIPTPDNMISFEDLMIFAMNYGVVAAKVVPFLGEPGVGDLALALVENGRTEGMVELALRLEGNLGDVKGLTAELEFEGLEFVAARLSDEMSSPLGDVFFWSDAASRSVQVDAAVLGTDVTIGGSGDVAVLTFQVLDETYSVDFTSAELRGSSNEDLTAELDGLSSEGVPVAFRLVQNTPNPFNPVTKVAYHVPHESRVTIRVFDVTGRLVTTLVDGVVEPGRHAAVWNGTNDYGESVSSGVYFCTMETPDYSSSLKMTLLK